MNNPDRKENGGWDAHCKFERTKKFLFMRHGTEFHLPLLSLGHAHFKFLASVPSHSSGKEESIAVLTQYPSNFLSPTSFIPPSSRQCHILALLGRRPPAEKHTADS
jgi:hypothetical protein